MRLRRVCSWFLLSLVGVVLSGCDDNPQFREYWYSGTQIGVEACIERNFSSLVDKDTLKESCVQKHRHATSGSMLSVTLAASYAFFGPELHLYLFNGSKDQIITQVDFIVSIAQPDGPDLVLKRSATSLWVMPGSSSNSNVFTVFKTDVTLSQKANELLRAGSKHTWDLTNISAVQYKLRD